MPVEARLLTSALRLCFTVQLNPEISRSSCGTSQDLKNRSTTLFERVSGLLPTDAVPYPRTNVKVATPPRERQTLLDPLDNIYNEDNSTTTL